MRSTDAPGDTPHDPSVHDHLPELARIARVMADAVIVTDLHRRVAVWNDAAHGLYGIDASTALGASVESLFDSVVVGAEATPAGVRALALERGSWRGRVADRPIVGTRLGQEVVLDVTLSRLTDPDGELIGVLSVKRDVTAGVRLERELAGLGSLATATGEARSRVELAQRALDVVAATTGARNGAIIVAHGDRGRVLASLDDLPGVDTIADVRWRDAPAIRAVAPLGRVVKGPVDRVPLLPENRRRLLDGGVRSLLVVGLHREDELIGVLSLGWPEPVLLPSDDVTLLVATTIARGLENARLVEEIVRRAESQRATAVRIRKLEGLTRLGSHVESIDELAEASARLINDVLEADGTAYGLLAPDRDSYATSIFVDVPAPFEAWMREWGPRGPSAFQRWRARQGAFIEPLESGHIPDDLAAIAREAGLAAFAVMPIRIADDIVGRIAVYFARPVAELGLDAGTLEQVATIASISLENFRLGDRLVRSERRYRAMFEESPDAMLLVTPDSSIIDANDAALRMFAAPREWLLGRRPDELIQVDPTYPPMAATLPVGASFRATATGIRRDGTRFPHESAVAAIELDGERRLMVRMLDLTDQERLQSELIQAQKMDAIGRLVSGVAHELNNPLAAILGFSQLIRRDEGLPETLRENADLLIQEADRTRGIVQNLLDFARRRPPERHPTPIAALVDSVLTLESYRLGQGPIEVDLEIGDDLPLVELDRGQIQQVLINLVHNAAYAIESGGGSRLGIRAEQVGRDADAVVRVTVLDDGPGVAEGDLDRLFEPFFTTKPPAEGTGLGLSVSAGIVQAHGGELRYGPSGWGSGAAFSFDLPVRSRIPMTDDPPPGRPIWDDPASVDRAGPPPSAVAPEPRPDGPRILVLDDEASIRTFLEQALRALGYRPVVAAKGEEAVELATTRPFDLVVCDHKMGGMSGIEVYETIVAARPELADRWILMSGDVLNPGLEAFAASREVSLLAKPFDLETLGRTLRYRLEAAARSSG